MDIEETVVAATFKILVLGDSDVGKTSLIKRYSTGLTPMNFKQTIGIDFTDVVVSVRRTKVKLRIWDTAGQEKFHTFTRQFFRGTQGIMLVYDITNMNSFQMLQKWNHTIEEAGLSDISMVVVGNKSDLEDCRIVPRGNAEQLSARNYRAQYIETSVNTGENVKNAFYLLAENLIHSHNIFQAGREIATLDNRDTSSYDTGVSPTERITDSIKLEKPLPSQKHSGNCCLK